MAAPTSIETATGYHEPPDDRQLQLGADDLERARAAAFARACHRCRADAGEPCRTAKGKVLATAHVDRQATG